MLKVIIFDDASADLALLETALAGGAFEFVAQHAGTQDQLFAAIARCVPDVVLVGDSLPDGVPPAALARLRRDNPEVPIVLIAATNSDDAVPELLMAGARDYVLRRNLRQLPAVVERAIEVEQGIRARKSAERATKRNEEWFRLLFDNAPDAIVIYDADEHRFVDANAQAETLFGCGHEEIIKHGPEHFYSAEQPDQRPVCQSVAEHDALALRGERLIYERCIRRPTGEERLCLVTMVELPSRHGHLLRGSFVDITERSRAEADLRRTYRALRTLSRGNAAVVRSVSEEELLNGMCRVIVEVGGYRMACIGEVQRDAEKSVRFVAWAGDGADRFAAGPGITWGGELRSAGITGRAILTGEPQTSQNFQADLTMAPWREAAAEFGIASAVTLPLKNRSGVFGVLRICATEANAFDSAALSLLQELADDLSYGINTLRDRSAHAATERRWRVGLEATIGAFANMVELRDPYTSGHQQRVANLSLALAQALGLSADDMEGLYLPPSCMTSARSRSLPKF